MLLNFMGAILYLSIGPAASFLDILGLF